MSRAGSPPPLPRSDLELVEDSSPPHDPGFLRLVRRRLRVRYPGGQRSEPFLYDEIDRAALDAVVLAVHFSRGSQPFVYLRSALRPPFHFRDPAAPGGALWELPAGLIEPHEPGQRGVLQAAARELEEELGFRVAPEDFAPLGSPVFPCPGVMAERQHFVRLEVDPSQRGQPSLDGSALEVGGLVEAVALDEALAWARAGQLPDGKTELGLRRLADCLGGAP